MGKINWKIRTANLNDWEKLKSCMISAYSSYLDRLNGKPLPPMEVDYREEIASYPVWVAESGGEIVGGLVLLREESYLTIANVAVHPDFQGNGLGRGLMNFAETEARQRDYYELRLATHVLLTENLAFYTQLGWKEIERDDLRIYMRKIIGK